jgi:hypothetical protein
MIGESEAALEESIKATAGTKAPKLRASAKPATIRQSRTIAGREPCARKNSRRALSIGKFPVAGPWLPDGRGFAAVANGAVAVRRLIWKGIAAAARKDNHGKFRPNA